MSSSLQLDIIVAIIVGMISGVAGYFVSKYMREPLKATIREGLS